MSAEHGSKLGIRTDTWVPFRASPPAAHLRACMVPRTTLHWRLIERLTTMHPPLVMGVVNATPDSFHPGSRTGSVDHVLGLVESMLGAGADIIDIGGQSSRPGSQEVSEADERSRVLPLLAALVGRFPQALFSIDTYRAGFAKAAVEHGARLVNDISAGTSDPRMLDTVAHLGVPYVAMHMQGTPATMQHAPAYTDVVDEVTRFLSDRLNAARAAGIADVILDPGFGFGKTTAHNFDLLRGLPRLAQLGAPILVGLSRKRMIQETLGVGTADAMNGTTVLNTLALLNGASIIRVHDVREAAQVVALLRASDMLPRM